MKPLVKFKRIYQKTFKKCLVFYIGIFLCMYLPGIYAEAKCGRPGHTKTSTYEPKGTEFKEKEIIRYNCTENDHVILGNTERRCLHNGSWSDEMPVCSEKATIKHAQLYFQGSQNEDNVGYTVDGDVSTCSETLIINRTLWRGFLAKSMNIFAVRVTFISNTEVDIDVQVIQENFREKCRLKPDDKGFTEESKKTLTFYCPTATTGSIIQVSCNSLPFTLCEISVLGPPDSACLWPDRPLHGTTSKHSDPPKREIYTFQCDEGYKLFGALSVTCQTTGTWSPRSPICDEIFCHRPEAIENGIVEYTENKFKIPYNGTAKYSCKEGFLLFGKSVIRCHRYHEWDYPPPECKPQVTEMTNSPPQTERWRQNNVAECRNLPQIANGALTVNSSHIGSVAWLKCNEGFRPLTEDHIICLSNGEWSLHNLYCTIIQCDSNPTIPHGKGILQNNPPNYGSYLHIICDEDYTAQTIYRMCDEHGSWGDLNICVEITCGPFKDDNNGTWTAVNGSSNFYVLMCPENFHIEGSPAYIRCLRNGSWSYTSAKCQKSLLLRSFWDSNWTPSLVLIAAIAAGIATAVFILCLSVVILVLKKRREAQTNTTVFHLEDTTQKEPEKEINSQRQKHHSAAENYNTVEFRCKSVCTFPRKPRSALPNLPVDADPVYAQPFETATFKKKSSVTVVNKKEDYYNTHIYAEPVDSKRNTPNHVLVNIDNLRMGTEKRLSVTRTNIENNLASSTQTDQQNCDKTCAIYDSSINASLNSTNETKKEHLQSYDNNELGSLKKNLEYMELR